MGKSFDFTKGSIRKKMVLFSLPMLLTNLLQTSYQFIDSLWVGKLLGDTALGAVAVSSTIIFCLFSFIIGINSAALTIISQLRGANNQKGLRDALNSFVVTLGILSIVFAVMGFCLDALLYMLYTPSEIVSLASDYLKITFLGAIFLFGYNFFGTILYAVGDSRTPIFFVLITVIMNAILNPLFISGLKLGIAGSAYATIGSQGLAFLFSAIYSTLKTDLPFSVPHKPKLEYIKLIFRLGFFSGLQALVISSGVTATMGIVAGFGERAITGFGTALRLDSIIMIPIITLGSAVTSLAGQNIGIQKWDRVAQITKNALLYILCVTLMISTVVYMNAEQLIQLFVKDKATIAFGVRYLKLISLFYPFLGINFVLNGVVRASGAVISLLILSAISFWVLRIPIVYFVSKWLGEDGIAIGMGMSFVISSITVISYYGLGRWRKNMVFT